ncbi:MAG TPA: anibiotic ABC transporter [Erwinia persicina]|uniref:HlyD family secretion protein n=1 Tax=Erwinia persicina TaxID=55211 RepID=UPI0007881CB9|nr:HlyD family efflux transporter periplasmic adaptor subunit [Erwinia persicina]MBD8167997.1 HlyD family efflux transporter periplasmic adaptor subunit [Erwinia persicina]MCQ4107237.1 HlyD family secretion protein [Erwinia persicina]UTX13796.1 HlyD family secretion protein [Erwinia persicina]HBH67863.1 anibiotic ABC transporter [Erwinia persicina]HBI06001.1 anibiotic ABC transporter [Erwinia persicina]
MNNDLFRQEALEAKKTKVLGSVALYCPPFRWLIITLVCALVAVLITFCIFGSYTKRETAKGVLVPENGMMTITAMTAGTVITLPAHEGDRLEKGAQVASISSEISTRFGQTREAIARQLDLQQEGLKQQLSNLEQLNAETLKSLQEKASLLQQQSVELDTIYRQRTEQIGLAKKQLDKARAMRAEGYASNTEVEKQQNDMLDASVRLQDVARQRIDVRQQLSQARQQLREQPITYSQQKNDIQQKLSEIAQSMMENESRRSVDLRTPERGTVSAVLVKQGQIVSAGQTLAIILPDNAHLQARIMLSSRAVGFIRPGQRVVLRYQSFPWQTFGQQYGTVKDISTSALSPQEISTITGDSQVQEPMYQVKVAVDHQTVQAYGKEVSLRAGSGLEADFIVDKRRIYQWVLEPLNALGKMTSI